MEAFKERLLVEFREADERKNRLGKFIIDSPEFSKLSNELQTWMKKQCDAMTDYVECLKARIDILITPEEIESFNMPSEIVSDKRLRIGIDGLLQQLKSLPGSRERVLAITKLQEAIMWLGMDLKRLNPNGDPYKNGNDASNEIVDQTSDGLKL